MTKKQEWARESGVNLTPERIARDDAIAARYEGNPSFRQLYERGDIDKAVYDRASRLRAAGPPVRPFWDLIATLRAERERQGLSLSDITRRSGMDRSAVHKLEIGLNKNPTADTLNRYAEALGKKIGWSVTDLVREPAAGVAVVRSRGKDLAEGGSRKARIVPKPAACMFLMQSDTAW
ncbi:MAG: hypothetical protein NVSMB9_21290 [Isosphaeraceae bacterium]